MRLAGARVLLTRPEHQAAGLLGRLSALGAFPSNLPLFGIEAAGDDDAHRAALDGARGWDGWIVTSANAARRTAALDRGAWPALFATGPATARARADLGHPDARHVAASAASEALLDLPELRDANGRRFLICAGEGGRALAAETLRARGATVRRIDLYRRVPVAHDAAAVERSVTDAQAVVVTSGEGLERLWSLATPAARAALLARVLVVPSVRVLELAHRLGFPAPLAPAEMSDPGLVRCLEQAPDPATRP